MLTTSHLQYLEVQGTCNGITLSFDPAIALTRNNPCIDSLARPPGGRVSVDDCEGLRSCNLEILEMMSMLSPARREHCFSKHGGYLKKLMQMQNQIPNSTKRTHFQTAFTDFCNPGSNPVRYHQHERQAVSITVPS